MIVASRLSLDCYLPSLPAISTHFQTTQQNTQFTLTAFLIGFAGSQIFYGPLSDSYGRKKIILVGLSIFISGIILCICSISIKMLMFARFLAGTGAGVSSALKRAVSTDLYTDFRLAKANALLSNATVLTMLIAPLLGSYIQHQFGWRFNFVFMLLYLICIFILLLSILPETYHRKVKLSLTIPSLISNYLIVLKHPPFYKNICYSTCSFSGMAAFTTISSFLFIHTFDIPIIKYGWLMMLLAVSYLSAGFFVNFYVQKIGMRKFIILGLSISLCAGICLSVCSLLDYINIYTTLISAIMFVIGARIVIPNATARSLSPMSTLSGYASSLIGMLQASGAAVCSFIITHLSNSGVSILAFTYLSLSVIPLAILLLSDRSEQIETISASDAVSSTQGFTQVEKVD